MRSSSWNVLWSKVLSCGSLSLDLSKARSAGSIWSTLIWYLTVSSSICVCIILIINGISESSDTLKKAITTNTINMGKTATKANHLLIPRLTIWFRSHSHKETHKATTINCMRVTRKGPIWKEILNRQPSMCLGKKVLINRT